MLSLGVINFLFAVALAITSLLFATAALILAIKSFRRAVKGRVVKMLTGAYGEAVERSLGIRRLPMRRVNSLAEAAVILGAEILVLFDNQGLIIETYNMSKEYGARAAASLAELINMLKGLGFPAEILIFKNSGTSLVVELRKVGDVTPYCLIIGGPATAEDAEYAREILQRYVESVISRR